MILPEILRRKDIEKRFGLSRSTIYAMMADGRFPKPVKLGLSRSWMALRRLADLV